MFPDVQTKSEIRCEINAAQVIEYKSQARGFYWEKLLDHGQFSWEKVSMK